MHRVTVNYTDGVVRFKTGGFLSKSQSDGLHKRMTWRGELGQWEKAWSPELETYLTLMFGVKMPRNDTPALGVDEMRGELEKVLKSHADWFDVYQTAGDEDGDLFSRSCRWIVFLMARRGALLSLVGEGGQDES